MILLVINKVDIQTQGNEKYGVSLILAICGDNIKLPSFIIIKGEKRKTIEKQIKIYIMLNNEMFIHCLPQGWCTTKLFCIWIKEVFIPYEN